VVSVPSVARRPSTPRPDTQREPAGDGPGRASTERTTSSRSGIRRRMLHDTNGDRPGSGSSLVGRMPTTHLQGSVRR